MADNVVKVSKTLRKEKIIILASWFVGLIAVRLLLASLLTLKGTWIATAGSVGIIFAIFYLTLKYTPLSRYSGIVNSVLLSWFSKRYLLWGVLSSMIVLSTLIFLVEFGYLYHSDELVSYEQFRDIDSNDNALDVIQKLFSSPGSISVGSNEQKYRIIESMSILVASVDMSLGGYYRPVA